MLNNIKVTTDNNDNSQGHRPLQFWGFSSIFVDLL